ncbi:putative nucleoporin [Calycina marina]|uniref:Nucleoporin n=1 Tax=Calycina marina TaxID=1763456 RepID=A0A9P8CGR7_9HELO|nr:putative nucleoporin [Calycina marina]
MSFGGFGGGGGFGQNTNNNNAGGGFGGFGANNNATTTNAGFGNASTPGLGSTNTTGGIFGGGTSAGFGGGGFGTNTGGGFGAAKPAGAFGTTTGAGGGLFGTASNTATASNNSFGGFGSTPVTTTNTFSGGNTGASMFGGNKTGGFGSNTAGGFGTPTSAAAGFGNSGGGFGTPAVSGGGECQGTGAVPFSAFVEKEPNNSTQQNAFQTISFQQPYTKFSQEELRLADYAQGRKHGNQSNQPGAFGASNFGGFGATANQPANSGFGSTATATTGSNMFGSGSGFGTSQPANTGFGTATPATTGGLFGKPANSLFGAQPAAQPAAGSLFGGGGTSFGGAAAGGFGTASNTTASPSLFGGATTANKGFSFGNAAPASTNTGFGTTPAATTGFAGGGLFGNNTAAQPAATGFGAQLQQQPATSNVFGGFGQTAQPATNSLFGNAQPAKSANSPFGGQTAAATGTGGLFGSAQPAATSNSIFGGGNNNQTASGGLFGPKPETTGTSLFNSNTQANTGGGGLFGSSLGNNQNQSATSATGGLFGGLGNNSQPKPGGLFGSSQPAQPGGGIFGNSSNQQPGGGLFGTLGNNNNSQSQQQQPQNSFPGGSSLFASSQQSQQQNQQQTPQALVASINDPSAFGNGPLFAGLAAAKDQYVGPLATPLSGSTRKKAAAVPIYKLNPASSSRFSTPAKRGFGFSYSTYGSPASASSTASTPGLLGNSMLGGSLSRGLSKSMSTSSLRHNFNTEDSILAPGAFSSSPNSRQFGSAGSIKKLVINRGLRSDLFTPPPQKTDASANAPAPGNGNNSILKKRVSFDAGNLFSAATNGTSSPLKQAHTSATPTSQELGFLRPSVPNSAHQNGESTSEMEQVRSNELAIVHEEDTPPVAKPPLQAVVDVDDEKLGAYWIRPTMAQIESMTQIQQKSVVGLTVGRQGAGQVTFKGAVDLTKISIRDLFDTLVQLNIRSCTVYPTTGTKPPRGQGLNVPSKISLNNSWPRSSRRSRGGSVLDKHISALRKVKDTTFESYDAKTGVWTFSVPHFTTYGLDYDEEDDDGASEFGQSTLSALLDSPTPTRRSPESLHFDESFVSTSQVTESDPDDTFQFKKRKMLPGTFDDQALYEEDDNTGSTKQAEESFLDERSVGSQSEDDVDVPVDHDEALEWGSAGVEDGEIACSFSQTGNTAEQDYDSQADEDEAMGRLDATPGGYAMARMRALKEGTTVKRKFSVESDWTNALKTTVSPQKQDRALLKSFIDIHGNDARTDTGSATKPRPRARVVSDGCGFATSIDLMNSLFNQTDSPTKKSAKVPVQSKGFEWPYSKRSKTSDNNAEMTESDRAYHDSMKPSWGPDGTLVYAAPPNPKSFGRSSRRTRDKDGLLTIQKGRIISESRDIRFAKFSNEVSAAALKQHIELTVVDQEDGIPFAALADGVKLSDFMNGQVTTSPPAEHENLVWQLASILWDSANHDHQYRSTDDIDNCLRKRNLSIFWEKMVDNSSSSGVALASSGEEKAVASLSGHRVADACGHLINSKNFHLATLVALIGGKESMRRDIRQQIQTWRSGEFLSEFSQPIRAIYEMLAGNVCVCDGIKGGAVENRYDSFTISQRFGLNWRQAFGLRLWYGILATDDIQQAVVNFYEDLRNEKEQLLPVPWYVEQKIELLWEDKELVNREDLLWGLLRLYTFDDTDLEAVLRPENCRLSPLDTRLSWQLSRALVGAGNVTYSDDPAGKADQLTISFASQLTNEGSWLEATFVLLHLSSSSERTKALQDHLARHASVIGAEGSQSFAKLHRDLKIPLTWIWEAKSLFARSVKKDPQEEVYCLLQANLLEEAHRTFSREVAPKAIIERNYDSLRTLLDGFNGKEDAISEWHLGGETYRDFLELVGNEKRRSPVDNIVLERLITNLPAMNQTSRNPEFLETVAIEIMSGDLAQTLATMAQDGYTRDLPNILKLPHTEDNYLRHSIGLSLGYYQNIMESGK